jgi:hypothetical protein
MIAQQNIELRKEYLKSINDAFKIQEDIIKQHDKRIDSLLNEKIFFNSYSYADSHPYPSYAIYNKWYNLSESLCLPFSFCFDSLNSCVKIRVSELIDYVSGIGVNIEKNLPEETNPDFKNQISKLYNSALSGYELWKEKKAQELSKQKIEALKELKNIFS